MSALVELFLRFDLAFSVAVRAEGRGVLYNSNSPCWVSAGFGAGLMEAQLGGRLGGHTERVEMVGLLGSDVRNQEH